MAVIDFPGQFPEQLCRQGRETLTEPEERRRFADLLRHHRATIRVEADAHRRKSEYLERIIDDCDRLIEPLEEEPETEA